MLGRELPRAARRYDRSSGRAGRTEMIGDFTNVQVDALFSFEESNTTQSELTQGILLRRKGNFRVVISIELIQRSVAVDTEVADVEALS